MLPESLAGRPGRVLAARVRVDRYQNPRIADPCRPEGEFDVNGRLVRAHGVGPTTDVEIRDLAERLAHQLRRTAQRRLACAARPASPTSPTGARRPARPAARPLPRPPEQRRVIRRKTFALEHEAQAAAEAAPAADRAAYTRP